MVCFHQVCRRTKSGGCQLRKKSAELVDWRKDAKVIRQQQTPKIWRDLEVWIREMKAALSTWQDFDAPSASHPLQGSLKVQACPLITVAHRRLRLQAFGLR
mmetsp:Transcript_36887/g.72526  ORF Transcript_36887/g.72526 Transcript_36887/m.72526 type:complete len:101 (-) Transcript_36887:215-517(-)